MKLFRPHIPLETRCRVALRQLGEMWPDQVLNAARPKPGDSWLKANSVFVPRQGFGSLLVTLLAKLAELNACAVEDLRLDHDPPLALRPRERRGLGKKTYYTPDANDPEHLFYRPQGAQFAGSHDVKTRIRGDRGQFSDITLIKRERRREQKQNKTTFIHSSPKFKAARAAGRIEDAKAKTFMRKTKWPKRALRGSNRWPKPGEKKR